MKKEQIARESALSPKWNKHDRRYLAFVATPLLVLATMIISGIVTWRFHANETEHLWDRFFPELETIDEVTLTGWYDRRASQDQTTQLRRVLSACESVGNRIHALPSDTSIEMLFRDPIPPDDESVIGQVVAHFGEQTRPIIRSLASIAKTDEMIWQPILFEGMATQLTPVQQSRSLELVLRVDFLDAFHRRDSKRALEAVELYVHFFGSSLRPTFSIEEHVRGQNLEMCQHLIRKSLAYDVWSESDLADLQRMMSIEFDWEMRWNEITRGDLLLEYPWLVNRDSLYGLINSSRLRGQEYFILRTVAQLSRSAPSESRRIAAHREAMRTKSGAATKYHAEAVTDLELKHASGQGRTWSADQWVQVPLHRNDWFSGIFDVSYSNMSLRMVKWAKGQRWTRCAIAIKQFAVKHDRLPGSLQDLSDVGLPPAAALDEKNETFLFVVDSSGNSARLWDHGSSQPESDVDDGMAAGVVITITK